jgi:hypothetical protein
LTFDLDLSFNSNNDVIKVLLNPFKRDTNSKTAIERRLYIIAIDFLPLLGLHPLNKRHIIAVQQYNKEYTQANPLSHDNKIRVYFIVSLTGTRSTTRKL